MKNRLQAIAEARIAIEAALAGETPLVESVTGSGGARGHSRDAIADVFQKHRCSISARVKRVYE